MSREDYERICAQLAQTASKNKPDEYDLLTAAKKELLAYWISKAIQPASTYDSNTSYGIKHNFEAQTGVYVSNAEFKGAMLMAGYLPEQATTQNWRFKITKTYDSRKVPHDAASQREYRNLPYYRTQLNGDLEPELQQQIANVRGRAMHFLNDEALLAKEEAKEKLLKEAEQDREKE